MLLSLHSLTISDSIKWGLTLRKIVSTPENSAKDSTICWLPAGWSVNFLSHLLQVMFCLLKNISTLQLSTGLSCCSIMLNLLFLLDVCDSSFSSSYFLLLLFSFLAFILNPTFLCSISFVSLLTKLFLFFSIHFIYHYFKTKFCRSLNFYYLSFIHCKIQ